MDAGSERTDEEKNLRECRRLWRAWRTIHELCQDRVGCLVVVPVLLSEQ